MSRQFDDPLARPRVAAGQTETEATVVTRLTIDFRYVDIKYELWALGHMLKIIEPAIDHLSEQDEVETLEDLKRSGWEHDEAELDIAFQEIRDKRDYVLPRFMRGPFLVSLWACYESAVQMVARTMRNEIGAPLALSELRGESFLARAHRYFQALLGMPLDSDEARYSRLADLYRVRHALAHANGLREGMTQDGWAKLERTLAKHGVKLDMSRGLVVLTSAYVESAFSDVEASLRSLVMRAERSRGGDQPPEQARVDGKGTRRS